MTETDLFFQSESLDAALADYTHATVASGRLVGDLLGVTVSSSGPVATTLAELRRQVAPRLQHRDTSVGVVTAPAFDIETYTFGTPWAAAARFGLRSAIRLVHGLGFTPHDEITVGEMAVSALRMTDCEIGRASCRERV